MGELVRAELRVGGRLRGAVDVCYSREMPGFAEGPFLQEERSLNAQIAGESEYDASRLNRVRDEVRSFQVQLGPRDAWEQVARIFAARWTLEVSSRDDREGYSTQSGSFRMQSPTVADWREIVDTVAAAEKAPGAAVTDFEMKAGGDRIHPAIDLVRIGVSIRSHPAGEKGKIP